MKLKAPEGVGDPCVDGVTVAPRGGVYEVEAEVGALLIECFGFMEVAAVETRKIAGLARRGKAAARKAPAEG
jgi:hypothetical protein